MSFLSNLISNANRKKIRPTTRKAKKVTNTRSRFRGVQLNPNNEDCCEAVRASLGKRFLSDSVPMLPLPECDAGDCGCTYELFDDRRTDIRRAADVAYDLLSQLRLVNRRNARQPGRRQGD